MLPAFAFPLEAAAALAPVAVAVAVAVAVVVAAAAADAALTAELEAVDEAHVAHLGKILLGAHDVAKRVPAGFERALARVGRPQLVLQAAEKLLRMQVLLGQELETLVEREGIVVEKLGLPSHGLAWVNHALRL